MRLSAKGPYAIAASIYLGIQYKSEEYITVISISESLDISKIYLEQVFSLLKHGNIVTSIKGSHGGYRLTREPSTISVYDILSPIENTLFEASKETVPDKTPGIEKAMQDLVFTALDSNIESFLKTITLEDLVTETEYNSGSNGYMFYI